MSFFSGSSKNAKLPDQKLLGQDEQRATTNEQGRAVPLMYGLRRMGVTLLSQAFDVWTSAITEKFGKKRVTTGYQYYCSFAALVCHGPVDRIDAIYLDNTKVWPAEGASGITRNTTADKIVSVDILDPGEGIGSTSYNFNNGGAGSGAVIEVKVHNGTVHSVRVVSMGSGFSEGTPPTLTFTGTALRAPTFKVNVGSEPYVDITLTNPPGVWRLYWGTDGQQIDDDLLRLSADNQFNPDGVDPENPTEEHTAYAGQCYLVVKDHLLGTNRQNLQNIELVVGRWPTRSWLVSSKVEDDCDVASIVLDAMCHARYGLGIPDTAANFDRAKITSFSDQTGSNEALAVSPVIDRPQPFDQVLADVLEYVDGFHSVTKDGKFSLGIIREVPCGDGTLPVIDESCLTEVPDVSVASFSTTQNDVRVRFTNRTNSFKEDSFQGNSAGHREVTGEPSPLILDRKWITRPAMADWTARAVAKVYALPAVGGVLKVRRSKLGSLVEGGGFYLHYPAFGLCFLHCRCVSITQTNPQTPVVEIEWEVDRAYQAKAHYTAPQYVATPRNELAATPFVYQKAIELPYDPAMGEDVPFIGFLAARTSSVVRGLNLWVKGADDSYDQDGSVDYFPFHGTLTESYSEADSDALKFTIAGVDLELPTVTEEEADRGRFIALIGDEFFSLFDITVTGTNQYEASAKREYFDTAKAAHAIGDDVWLFDMPQLRAAAHRADNGRTFRNGDTQTFKLQPLFGNQAVDLADVTNTVAVTFTDRRLRPWKPRGLTGPETFTGLASLTFSWEDNPRNRDGYRADFKGPVTVFEIRKATDPATYPNASPRLQATLYPGEQFKIVTAAQLTAALGTLQDFYVRVFTKFPGGILSRSFSEIFVTYAP